MFHGVLALLGRSLRIDARSWQTHLARFGLMAAIYISLAFAFATGFRFGAPGLRFFRAILWLNISFLTLLGIGFFSTAISEEKEEDTLGLMQMAGISPLGILLGKIGGRLIQALLLIAVQYPFTLLAVTMGGVTGNQVRCAFLGLTAYMLLMSGLGLLCSTVAARNRTASGLMTLGLVLYVAVPYSAYEIHRYGLANGLLAYGSMWTALLYEVSSMCLLMQVETILTSSFGESPWSTQVVSDLIGFGLGFVLAWVLFGVFTHNPSSEATSRGMLTRKRGMFRWCTPGRPWFNPYLWKDFYFVGGGVGMVLVRIAFYVALMVASFVLSEVWWGGVTWPDQQYPFLMAIGTYQTFLLFAITIETALLTARSLHDEVHHQTLATLVMLPESTPYIVYSKFAGALMAGSTGICCLALVSLLTAAGRYHTGEFLDKAAGWFFLAHFVMVPHLAAVLALHMRWGRVPLAIGLGIGSLVGWVSMFEAMRIGQDDGVVWLGTITAASVSVGCHVWIASRVKTVAERG